MATRVVMPHVAETVVEGTIGKWLKKVGEKVERDEPLAEVVTDKVTVEIPSPAAGVLQKITAPEGAVIPVGGEMAIIEEVGAPARAPAAAPVEAAPEEKAPPKAPEAIPARAPVTAGERERISPAVRRLAQEYGVDVSQVGGTGLGGRVTREDILNYVAKREKAPARPEKEAIPPAKPGEEEIVPVTPIRRAIAERMLRSKQTAPHAWTAIEVDVTPLVKFRESIKEDFRRREGVDLTYLPFFIKAVVNSLKEHPLLNSSWAEDKIVIKKRINIGVAVATDDGLIVPVIHDADEKSITGLAKALNETINRARPGKLTIEDVQGGTFTVNNTGAFGSVMGVPIMVPGQAAILNFEAITKRPVVINDAIAIRSMINICCSFDHRISDGLIVGRFLQSVRSRLEAMGPDTPIN
ncbi:MAG: 2-oxo acid dehydrogenase subunit E2 [Chloroflexi bacterium]|nr:2-oxo acid dehydrogenase subunit E2 [Chloroflexota bacterium]